MGVHRGSPEVKLEILDLKPGVEVTVDPGMKQLSSQCWSPDDKGIVYEAGDGVRTYEVGNEKSLALLAPGGKAPTWSPDSHFVAYVSLARFALDDVYELRARRLADDSEGRIAEGQISGDYQWLISPQLARQAGSETKLH